MHRLALIAVFLGGSLALAQDIPAAPDPLVLPGVPSVEEAPLQFVTLLLQLGQQGRFGPLIALLVFAAVFILRKFAGKLPEGQVRAFLLGTWGGWLLNLATALSAGLAGLLLGGGALSVVSVLGVLGGALTYSLAAAGLVELKKDAAAKGEAAAATIATKGDAVSILEKGPPAP